MFFFLFVDILIGGKDRKQFTGLEGCVLLLLRFSTPKTLKEISTLSGRSISSVSSICNFVLNRVEAKYRQIIEFDHRFFTPQQLDCYSAGFLQ